ncbi:flagellar hook-length control protein FliK [Sporosarcina beigongshangi]|uniref:flagellar hook-length control protein FliK n=1 Tax=Sporosarcina beigongshangi TaxID=2782538 RepID=UPI00193A2AF4|nr:flagellar hook-length control protein FliK [Sporosarcina beigongshangi]
MNIAAIQAMPGQNLQTPSNGVQSGQASAGTFGSVFGSAVAAGNAVIVPVEQQPTAQVSNDSIQAILNAQSVEELEVALKELGSDGVLVSMLNVGSLEEVAGLLNIEPKQLMDSILSLLEKAGLSQEELTEVAYSTDFWTVLNAVDKVAPQFFAQLSDELAGKGELSKQQAVDLLTILKTVSLIAPKTDLLVKQEQQVFSLQSYLVAAAGQFEETLNANSTTKLDMLQFMDSKSAVRFVIQTNPGQSQTDDESANKNAEPSQQVSTNVANAVTVPKGEFTITEAENRNNAARNEALVREMQTVFKRANFGQTGGTNRLLIKLYPEHLGQVRIELLQVNGIMTARILASTALGKEMLDSQLNQLRQAFLQQNLPVERIDVSQTLQDTARNDREQGFNQQFKQDGQETNDRQEQNDEEQLTFQEYMIELEV